MRRIVRIVSMLPVVAALSLASCQAFTAWIVANTQTTKKVEAQYEVPKGKKILVLVESSLSETDQPVARMLTERLNKRLRESKVAAETVPYDSLLNMSATAAGFANMRPAEVGKRLKADMVCYVLVHEFRLKDKELGHLWRGQFEAAVSMVDVESGRQVWPVAGHEGYWVDPVRTPPTMDSSSEYEAVFAGALCDEMADRIAKLFYEHEAPAVGEEQGSRDVWSGY